MLKKINIQISIPSRRNIALTILTFLAGSLTVYGFVKKDLDNLETMRKTGQKIISNCSQALEINNRMINNCSDAYTEITTCLSDTKHCNLQQASHRLDILNAEKILLEQKRDFNDKSAKEIFEGLGGIMSTGKK